MKSIPKGGKFFPTDYTPSEDIDQLIADYANGYAGAWEDTEAKADLQAFTQSQGFSAFASSIPMESGEGKLSLLFPAVEKHFPGCLPGPAQQRGSCVADCSKNAALASLANEIEFGNPDEITGLKEGVPELTVEGIKNGVLAVAYLYWWRGYNGDGWDCATAARMIQKNGMLLCKAYPSLNLDLTKYSGAIIGKYGRTPPPQQIADVGRVNVVRTTTECESAKDVCKMIANGNAVASCGGRGYSRTRNQDGVSDVSGRWAHAMAYLGFDDRESTKEIYGGPLVLVQNSWGTWNSGPRKIRGTEIEIPHGSFWARWQDVSDRYCVAYSSVAGWPSKTLPDYGLSILG